MAMEQFPNYVYPRPPTEIEVAEEDIPSTSVISYTRGYPLPSPSQYGSSSSPKEGQEPTLYKKVIYIPDVQLNQNVAADQKKSDWKQRSKRPLSDVMICEQSHEHEQPFQSHLSTLPTNKMKENGGERKQPSSTAWNVFRDLSYRLLELLHFYRKQWTHGLHGRMVFVAHLIFWASFLPAMIFGTWLQKKTNGNIGTAEVLFSSSICGIIFVLLGSQPVMIMGVSAPSLMFVVAVAETAHRLSLEFLPWMGCIGIWASLFLVILAVTNSSKIACLHLTLFSWEVVRMFAAMIFLWNGIQEILGFFSHKIPMDGSILSLWLATCTFVLGMFLSGAREWHCFDRQTREVIHNYGAAFTFLLFTGLSYLPRLEQVRLPRVQMGEVLHHTDNLRTFGTIVKLEHLPIWAVLLALIPGSLLAIMMFVDHNATAMLVEVEGESKSQKCTSKSWDLFILAGLTCLCSILGIPTCYGLYRQTMKHKHALTGRQNYSDEEIEMDLKGVFEVQRVSGIAASLLSVLPLLPGVLLLVEKVPKSLFAGFFILMSFSCLKDLQSTRRMRMFFMDSVQQPLKKVRLYTSIQLSCAVLVFVVSKTPAALLFPLFILATIWSRHYVLQQFFVKRNMVVLDQKLSSCDFRDIATVKTNHFLQHNAFQGGAFGSLEGSTVKENRSSGSSPSLESPSILSTANNRRLKERYHRRNKRKRQTSLEAPWGLLIKAEEATISLPRERERQCNQVVPVSLQTELPTTTIPQQRFSFSKELASQLNETDKPRLSTKTKKLVALKDSIEIHSNVLYDPCWGNEPQVLSVSVRKKAATLERRRVSCRQYADQCKSWNPRGLYTELYQPEAFDSSEENDQYYVSKVGKLRQGASTTGEGRSNKKLKLMQHEFVQSPTNDATEFAPKLAAVCNGITLLSLSSQGNRLIPRQHSMSGICNSTKKLQSRSMAMIDEDIVSQPLQYSSKNSSKAHTPRHQRKRQTNSLIAA
ncbi:hypothetical protein O6H91_06G037300 [Diphasiastrum complanatum]|uniref:Uncharacterized protein n=1 Tax=Diphasiastrum complanatum TaxID=34168 RepID=A0ACC2DCH9_DIPCM|nr:hypothetical protein O6H91_06G037300 [Diphasiastrum complanatum]